MKRCFKIFVTLMLSFIAGIVVTFAAYDVAVFQPHRSGIEDLIKAAHFEDRDPPALLQDLLWREGGGPSTQVSRQLLMRFLTEAEYRRGGSLGWHTRYFLWDTLVRVHLSKGEIAALYCSLANNGKGTGMNALAQRLYDRNLSQLSLSEAAEVVVYVRSPFRYARDREILKRHSEALLNGR